MFYTVVNMIVESDTSASHFCVLIDVLCCYTLLVVDITLLQVQS